jgi:hypothetical protein
VLSATGASYVDIVGHSQGGMTPRYYINFLGGDSKVNALVGLAPSNRGMTLNGLFTLASYFPGASQFATADCPPCAEQEAGSPFLTNLNRSGETRSGVSYTVIESQNGEVVTPYASWRAGRAPRAVAGWQSTTGGGGRAEHHGRWRTGRAPRTVADG